MHTPPVRPDGAYKSNAIFTPCWYRKPSRRDICFSCGTLWGPLTRRENYTTQPQCVTNDAARNSPTNAARGNKRLASKKVTRQPTYV